MAAASMAQGSMFEAIFSRTLKPTGAFAEELLREGFDLKHVRPEYPTQVWVACLAVARRQAFGTLSDEAAYRGIGRAFVDGFLNTLAGKIVVVAIPFLSSEGFLKRMPRYMSLGRSDVHLELTQVGPKRFTGTVSDPFRVPPNFLAGILEVGLVKTGATPTIITRPAGDFTHELDITW
jgi:uncharacterized protein (TIGR02265 family)